MAHKGLNIKKTMEEEILNNPEAYQTTFMIQQYHSCNLSNHIHHIKELIGKDKIHRLQEITRNLMLVTMNNVDDMNDLLASVTCINYDSCWLAFIPVLPVTARVRIKISGIPLPLALANQKDIKELFIDEVKELKDVVLFLEKVEGIQTGNLIVHALTDDLKVTHGKFKLYLGITCKNFHGTVKFIESFPVREESWVKYIDHSGIRVLPWR